MAEGKNQIVATAIDGAGNWSNPTTPILSKPVIAVTSDGTTACIMWNNSYAWGENRDIYCTTFATNEPAVLGLTGNKEVSEGSLLTNRAPIFETIGDKSVDERGLLEFTVSAIDPDGDTMTYSVINLPQGATFNAQTGTFTRTPDYRQSGDYVVTFVASDGDLSAGETIVIPVNNE